MPIQTFKNKHTAAVFAGRHSSRFPSSVQKAARRKLVQLDLANRKNDMCMPPGNRLEPLSGARAGQYSVRLNRQWRLCFVWRDGHAFEVEIADYH